MLKPLPLLLMIAVASPAGAQITFDTQPAPSPAAATAKDKNKSKLICETEGEIGTRLGGKKVCMTWDQWQEQRYRHREQVEKFQQMQTGTPSSADPG